MQKHTLGEVGNWTIIWWQDVSRIFVPKIIKISYRVSQKMAPFLYTLLFHQILIDFQNSFNVIIRRQFAIKLLRQIPLHLKWVDTLPCEMSNHALKPAMPLINIVQAWHVIPKQPRLKSVQLCCLGCSSTDGLSMLTIHDSKPANAGNRHWVGQTAAAFG